MNVEGTYHNYGLDSEAISRHCLNPLATSQAINQPITDGASQSSHSIELSEVQPSSGNHALAQSPQDGGKVTFVSGYPSSDLIADLQSRRSVSAEFWRRHLNPILITSSTTFEDIKVPSASCDIFQLRFWTIGSRGSNQLGDHLSINSLRSRAEALMDDYREQSGASFFWTKGDSIVRNYEVHDREYFSIEQAVTISVSIAQRESKDSQQNRWHGMCQPNDSEEC